MKVVKIIGNIFGIFFAILLSFVLFAMLIATPIVSTATNLITPNTINQVISEIDVETLLQDALPEESESGIPKEVITQFIKTDAAKEIITLYTEEVSATFKGESTDGISAEAINQIFNENIDELVDILYPYVPKEEQISKEDLKLTLSQNLEASANDITQMLPDVKELINQENNEIMQAATIVFSGLILKVCIFACVLLSLLIYALRFPRFKGFMWLGVVYLLATLVVLAIGIAGSSVSSASALLLESIPAEMLGIVTPIISVIFAKVTICGLVLLALTVLFITTFVLCRIFIVNKNKTKKAMEDDLAKEVEEAQPASVTE